MNHQDTKTPRKEGENDRADTRQKYFSSWFRFLYAAVFLGAFVSWW